jgi:hypothetical protein
MEDTMKKKIINLLFSRSVILVVIIMFLLMIQGKESHASVLSPSQCYVKIKIARIGTEIKPSEYGKSVEQHYVDFKIYGIIANTDACPVSAGQVYRIMDNNPGIFQKGEYIRAGVAFGSTMGSNGLVSWLHWSPLTYDDKTAIKGKNNITIDHLTSDDKPIEE